MNHITPEGREKRNEILRLRKEGKRLQEIADIMGISKQRVVQLLPPSETHCRNCSTFDKTNCVYPGLRNFLNENRWSRKKLIVECGFDYHTVTDRRFLMILRGEYILKYDDIIKIMKATNKSFEELFL